MKNTRFLIMVMVIAMFGCTENIDENTGPESIEDVLLSADMSEAEQGLLALEEEIHRRISALPEEKLDALKKSFGNMGTADQLAEFNNAVGNLETFTEAVRRPLKSVIEKLQKQTNDEQEIATLLAGRLETSRMHKISSHGRQAPSSGTSNYTACVDRSYYNYSLEIQGCFKSFSGVGQGASLDYCLNHAETMHLLRMASCTIINMP